MAYFLFFCSSTGGGSWAILTTRRPFISHLNIYVQLLANSCSSRFSSLILRLAAHCNGLFSENDDNAAWIITDNHIGRCFGKDSALSTRNFLVSIVFREHSADGRLLVEILKIQTDQVFYRKSCILFRLYLKFQGYVLLYCFGCPVRTIGCPVRPTDGSTKSRLPVAKPNKYSHAILPIADGVNIYSLSLYKRQLSRSKFLRRPSGRSDSSTHIHCIR